MPANYHYQSRSNHTLNLMGMGAGGEGRQGLIGAEPLPSTYPLLANFAYLSYNVG